MVLLAYEIDPDGLSADCEFRCGITPNAGLPDMALGLGVSSRADSQPK